MCLTLGVIWQGMKYKNSKNQNPGRQSSEMRKSLGREDRNFEEVRVTIIHKCTDEKEDTQIFIKSGYQPVAGF